MTDQDSKNVSAVTLYALQNCVHCKRAREYLENLNVPFKAIHVDMLLGDERNDTLRRLRRINPGTTFPTLVIGEEVIVGFKKDEIESALRKHHLVS